MNVSIAPCGWFLRFCAAFRSAFSAFALLRNAASEVFFRPGIWSVAARMTFGRPPLPACGRSAASRRGQPLSAEAVGEYLCVFGRLESAAPDRGYQAVTDRLQTNNSNAPAGPA
jgi:hypothetical protein